MTKRRKRRRARGLLGPKAVQVVTELGTVLAGAVVAGLAKHGYTPETLLAGLMTGRKQKRSAADGPPPIREKGDEHGVGRNGAGQGPGENLPS